MKVSFPSNRMCSVMHGSLALCVAVLGVGTAMAQTVKPLLAVPGQSTSALPRLDGLILSPAQRRNLEALRNLTRDDELEGPSAADEILDASSPLPDTLVVSGVVVRSGNRSTVWVNNQPLYGRADATPLRSLAGQAGILQPEGRQLQGKGRPGQVIDVPSGRAADLLPPGSIRIIPPKAGAGVAKRE